MNNYSELLKAQAHVWNHIFNFINSMSLKCAIELGIPEIIHSHGKPISISNLISALSIHPTKAHCIPRLMRILIHSGFFARAKITPDNDEEEGYVLTNSSQLLLKDNPFRVTPYLQAMLDPAFEQIWHSTSKWFQNEKPSTFETAHGMSLWEYAGHYPKINDFFNEGMATDAQLIITMLIDQGKQVFDGLSSVVDVGGGTGTVAKVIAEEFPHIECTVLDLPHVVAGLNGTPNLKYVAGDMFESIPPADAVILKWILHDWEDEKCLKILEQCKKAIKEREKGKLIIMDMVINEKKKMDNEDIETQFMFDMLMMILFNGKERTEKEWAKLFSEAGFSGYKIIPILGLRSVIEVYP